MKDRLCTICDCENIHLDESAFLTLTKAAKGDLRRAVMLLQSAVKFAGPSVTVYAFPKTKGMDWTVRACVQEDAVGDFRPCAGWHHP